MLRNEEGTGIVDRLSTLGCCNGGLAQLPPWLVYPLLGVLIGGFILWGELSGAKHVPVEDDGEARSHATRYTSADNPSHPHFPHHCRTPLPSLILIT